MESDDFRTVKNMTLFCLKKFHWYNKRDLKISFFSWQLKHIWRFHCSKAKIQLAFKKSVFFSISAKLLTLFICHSHSRAASVQLCHLSRPVRLSSSATFTFAAPFAQRFFRGPRRAPSTIFREFPGRRRWPPWFSHVRARSRRFSRRRAASRRTQFAEGSEEARRSGWARWTRSWATSGRTRRTSTRYWDATRAPPWVLRGSVGESATGSFWGENLFGCVGKSVKVLKLYLL